MMDLLPRREHRTEIDGLRAIAVLFVVLNHAGFTFFAGGFVGVDVFFVISGYLITQIIVRDWLSDRFSIIQFYVRRIRRIIPALIPVLAATLVGGYFTMLPDSFENFAQSVVATILFSNNILLSITSGYWDIASDFKPLLHTWSLGVEEQFYLFFPLIAILSLRFGRRAFVFVLISGFFASLLLSVILTPIAPTPSFYLLHTRAWELLLGSIGAILPAERLRRGGYSGPSSLLGLLLIAGSGLLINKALPYPSYFALLPAAGTFLVLVCTHPGSVTHKMLSAPPLVLVGVISYSVYLWHQPVFAFVRIVSVSEPPPWLMGVLSALVLVLGYLSWRFVEQPFRKPAKFNSAAVVAGAAASSALLLAAGLFIYKLSGLPARIPNLGLTVGRYIAFNESAFSYKQDAFSELNRPHVLVVGNSTGRDVVNIMLASKRFENAEIVYRDDINICDQSLPPTLGQLIDDADAVVVVANWTYDLKCTSIAFIAPKDATKPFVLVGPKHFGYNIDAYIWTDAMDRPRVRATLLADTVASDSAYAKIVPPDRYVDLLEMMHAKFGGVPLFDQKGHLLSVDRVHLTEAGAQFFSTFVFDNPRWQHILDVASAGAR